MPGPDGKLTPADFKVVQDWMLKYKYGNHPCPVCEAVNWHIGEYLVQPTTIGGGGLNFGLPGYPNVLLISPCGYTRMMNAVYLGLAPAMKK